MDEEKRILLAVVLSVVVISGSFMLQSYLAPPSKPQVITTEQTLPADIQENTKSTELGTSVQSSEKPAADVLIAPDAAAVPIAEERVVIETNLVRVVLTNKGGDVVSYKLKEHKDKDDYVEMVLPAVEESHAFSLAFGGLDAKPRIELFNINRVSDTTVEFYRDYTLPANNNNGSSEENASFRLIKRYDFKTNDYMFELSITLDGGYSVPSLNFNGVAYTLEFGPQIGPKFEKLDQRYEYRRYYTYTNGKQKTEKVDKKSPTISNAPLSWAAIAGKYFTFIAVPDAVNYTYAFSSVPVPGLQDTSRFYVIRPALNGSRTTDVLRFYLGPKTQKALSAYDVSDKNAFRLSGMNMSSVANTSGILGPVETVLKWFMVIFYKIIPNYGISIILLTILVKLLMFPLTKKGSESTIRMQELSPKIKEIQEKYKDNPTKMNTEMAELYKKEGYNPMAGCLPMLLQIPIFFAMYNLFNNHFDLRGAMFIPGWIPDLSLPESVFSFAPYKIPLLNWSDIRLLPFIYLVSQLLYGKVTQTPDQQNNSQMKMMLYFMPIMFFFILYDVPSGLLVYWIMSNLLTLVQQMIINRYLAKHKAMRAAASPVIAPKRKRSK